jgi:hypothetical protein
VTNRTLPGSIFGRFLALLVFALGLGSAHAQTGKVSADLLAAVNAPAGSAAAAP